MIQLQINMNQVIFTAFTVHTAVSICGFLRRVPPPSSHPPLPPYLVLQSSAPARLSVTWSDGSDTSRGYLWESNISPRVSDSLFVLPYSLLTTARLLVNTQNLCV
jgi:hypothetical protein